MHLYHLIFLSNGKLLHSHIVIPCLLLPCLVFFVDSESSEEGYCSESFVDGKGLSSGDEGS